MQTFLPYPDFLTSLMCLDYRRLGKQRVEAMQLIQALENPGTSRWENHPAAKMWKGHTIALKLYHNIAIEVWKSRGYKNNMKLFFEPTSNLIWQNPPWLGDKAFHASHRSNLLRKDPARYGKFGWKELPDLPYVWPVK